MNNDNKGSSKKDPNEDYSYFLRLLGSYMKSEREKAGYKNANSFANVIDIAESQYREYERGETDMQLSNFLKVFKGLNKKIEDIFTLNIVGSELTNGETSSVNPSLIETQVRNQVAKLNGLAFERTLNPDEIERIFRILLFCFSSRRRREILSHLKLSDKTANFLKIFKLLLANDWLEMQYPDNPNIPSQRYFTTEAGKNVVQLK